VFQADDERRRVRSWLLRGDTHRQGVRSDGTGRENSGRWPFHRRSNALRAAQTLRDQRARYCDETREQVDKLWDVNVRKIAVIYQDDAFGKAVLDGVKLALAKHNSTPVALGTFARNTLDVDEGMKSVMAAHPEAVVVVGPYAPVAGMVKKAHAAGWRPQFLTVSFVGTERIYQGSRSRCGRHDYYPGRSSLQSHRLSDGCALSQVSVEVLSGLSAELCEPGGVRGRDGRGIESCRIRM